MSPPTVSPHPSFQGSGRGPNTPQTSRRSSLGCERTHWKRRALVNARHFRRTRVRPREIRSQRLCGEQGVLPRRARAARRRYRLGGDADVRCACTKPRKSRRTFTWRSRPRIASKSTLSIVRLSGPVARTTVRPVCARTTTRTTMQLSSSVRTGTTSKWFATQPRRDSSVDVTSAGGLLSLFQA